MISFSIGKVSPVSIAPANLVKVGTNPPFYSNVQSFSSGNSCQTPNSPLICNVHRFNKKPYLSFQATSTHLLGQALLQPVTAEDATTDKIDGTRELKNKQMLVSDTSIFREVSNVQHPVFSNQPRILCKEKNPHRLNNNMASRRTNLDHLHIIRYPFVTDSAIKAILEDNTLVFVVDKLADKKNIKDAIKKIFQVQTKKVNTLVTPDGTKKAFVMLKSECNALDIAKKIKLYEAEIFGLWF